MNRQRAVRAAGLAIVVLSSVLLGAMAWPWQGVASAAWLSLVVAVGGSFGGWLLRDLVR